MYSRTLALRHLSSLFLIRGQYQFLVCWLNTVLGFSDESFAAHLLVVLIVRTVSDSKFKTLVLVSAPRFKIIVVV